MASSMLLMKAGDAVLLDRLGQDVAGLDAVDGDAVAGELERGGADEAVDAGLASPSSGRGRGW